MPVACLVPDEPPGGPDDRALKGCGSEVTLDH
jgi:hypothetical protein